MPTKWYNILPDLPAPLEPPLHPQTRNPIGPSDLAPLFPMEIIRQEVSAERFIEIPEEVREAYMIVLGRPSPLQRAVRLEKFLGTPAKIYFKREDLSPPGSHKPNTAIAQAYYGKQEGVEGFSTETGAGQWGSALGLACHYFDLKCKVFMVRASYDQKPGRRVIMNLYGADVTPSPSDQTRCGRMLLENKENYNGSLGIAISEAVEYAVTHEGFKYSLGSVLNHVLMHQTIIGQEAKLQFEKIGEYPDVVVGCVGGGSNFAGFAYPFYPDNRTEFVAVEPTSVPSMTNGEYTYDFGDTAEMAPLIKMYTLGHRFIPNPIHAGGLRYHGAAPTLSLLINKGKVRPVAFPQKSIFEAAQIFAQTQGIIPAPETAHAIKAVIDMARECKKTGEKKIIAFNFSGHGLLDLKGYEDFLAGRLEDY